MPLSPDYYLMTDLLRATYHSTESVSTQCPSLGTKPGEQKTCAGTDNMCNKSFHSSAAFDHYYYYMLHLPPTHWSTKRIAQHSLSRAFFVQGSNGHQEFTHTTRHNSACSLTQQPERERDICGRQHGGISSPRPARKLLCMHIRHYPLMKRGRTCGLVSSA